MRETLGIDLGTSSIKAARFDDAGRMLACAARAYHSPDEHDVDFARIRAALIDAICEVASAGTAASITAIGLSSQTNSFALLPVPKPRKSTGETPVPHGFWDRLLIDHGGQAVGPVHLWTGDWAAAESAEINERLGADAIAAATGMRELTGQMTAAKLLHLQRHCPQEMPTDTRVWLLPDMVTHMLCGRAITDASLWSLTGLYDLDRHTWWQPMLDVLKLRAEQLPTLSRAGTPAGPIDAAIADELHLPAGIPVAVGTLDHLAGAIAVGNTTPGSASLSTGTASCVVVTHDRRPAALSDGVVGPYPAEPALWYALSWSGLSSTGLNWYARQRGGLDRLEALLAEAAVVPAGADGWRAIPRDAGSGDAGFDFVRTAEESTRDETGHRDRPTDGQAMRAILECLTHEIVRLVDLAAAGTRLTRLSAIGGGARADVWIEMLGDRLGLPVDRPDHIEASVHGAAILAAWAADADHGR